MAYDKKRAEYEEKLFDKVIRGEKVELDTSYNAFKENTKRDLRELLTSPTDKEFEKYFNSYLPELEIDYQKAKAKYEKGEINICQFMFTEPGNIAYALDLMY